MWPAICRPVSPSSVPAKIDMFSPAPFQNRFDPHAPQNPRRAVGDDTYHFGVPLTVLAPHGAEVAATCAAAGFSTLLAVAGHNRAQGAGDGLRDLATQAAAGMKCIGGHVQAFRQKFSGRGNLGFPARSSERCQRMRPYSPPSVRGGAVFAKRAPYTGDQGGIGAIMRCGFGGVSGPECRWRPCCAGFAWCRHQW